MARAYIKEHTRSSILSEKTKTHTEDKKFEYDNIEDADEYDEALYDYETKVNSTINYKKPNLGKTILIMLGIIIGIALLSQAPKILLIALIIIGIIYVMRQMRKR